jgi:hypothetical protein
MPEGEWELANSNILPTHKYFHPAYLALECVDDPLQVHPHVYRKMVSPHTDCIASQFTPTCIDIFSNMEK